MKVPDMDGRSKEEIIECIKYLASSYTPEWNFNLENPDAGTVIALIYAQMFSETIKRFNQTAEKNKIEFFNQINANILPCTQSMGYVTFGLADTKYTGGVRVKKGTELYGYTQEDEERVIFQTLDNVYVVNSEVSEVFITNGSNDIISNVYNKENSPKTPINIFSLKQDNLQKHEMYMSANEPWNINSEAWITFNISVINNKDVLMQENRLIESDLRFEYLSEEGYVYFAEQTIQNGSIVCHKGENQPAFMQGVEQNNSGFWIRWRIDGINKYKDIFIDNISFNVRSNDITPSLIYANGIDISKAEYFPFGEKPALFSEVYFLSDEVLNKKNAEVKFSFHMDFVKIPIDLDLSETEIDWKIVMRSSMIKADKEYDITVSEIIWEYYNGRGWGSIKELNDNYSNIFDIKNAGKTVTLNFRCPDDMIPLVVNSANECCIRARILKINNQFKIKGNYITPLLSETSFSYEYKEKQVPDIIGLHNNMEVCFKRTQEFITEKNYFQPFYSINSQNTEIYLGFEIAPQFGPIKYLFEMNEDMTEKCAELEWEYYANSGWKRVNLLDQTQNFRQTGIVTIMGGNDFCKREMFSRNLYWIRIADITGYYTNNQRILPVIENIYVNSVCVSNLEKESDCFFSINRLDKVKEYRLPKQDVCNVEVWVEEKGSISEKELTFLEQNELLEMKYDSYGKVTETWVKWKQVDNFFNSSAKSRDYVVDFNNGIIKFGDGINGKTPVCSKDNSIRVSFCSGGGEKGNLPINSINHINVSLGQINRVNNFLNTYGGSNRETLKSSLKRNAEYLRTAGKCVTADDFEIFAKLSERSITKVKCISNFNQYGKEEAGSVTLVVMVKSYNEKDSCFNEVRARLIKNMKERMSGILISYGNFYIIEPRFWEYNIRAEIVVSDFDKVFTVREDVEERLNKFIDPIKGNFDGNGWRIGSMPDTPQLINAIYGVKGIQSVKNVFLTARSLDNLQIIETNINNIESKQFSIAVNGKYDIIINVDI